MATVITWKNKRKRSHYKNEGRNGFIFRVPFSEQVLEVEPCDDSMDQSDHGSLEQEQGMDAVQDIRKQLEVDRFIAQLKTELGNNGTEAELDECLKGLATDLMEGDLYFNYLEAEKLPEHPLRQQVSEGITTLSVNIDMYKRELGEWANLLDTKKALVEKAKRGYSTEKQLDFLTLQSKDVDALKSFLSSEQLSLLMEGHCGTPDLVSTTSRQLDDLNGQLDKEVVRLGSLCRGNEDKNNLLEASMVDETPKTIFRALKNMHS